MVSLLVDQHSTSTLQKIYKLLEDLNLNLVTKSDLLGTYDCCYDLHALIPLAIGSSKHQCAVPGDEERSPFSVVSDVSALSTAFSKYRRTSGPGEHFKKVVKHYRFDARDPAVSQFQSFESIRGDIGYPCDSTFL